MSYDRTYKYTIENNLFQKLKEKGVAREKLGAPENIKSGGNWYGNRNDLSEKGVKGVKGRNSRHCGREKGC